MILNQNPNHPPPSTPSSQDKEITQNKTQSQHPKVRKKHKKEKKNKRATAISNPHDQPPPPLSFIILLRHYHQELLPHHPAIAAWTFVGNYRSFARLFCGAPLLEAQHQEKHMECYGGGGVGLKGVREVV